jgi:hypothetical protein
MKECGSFNANDSVDEDDENSADDHQRIDGNSAVGWTCNKTKTRQIRVIV